VTIWGIVALVMGGVAVMSANVSALLPHNLLSGLHQTRLDAPTLDQLRLQVSDLRSQTRSIAEQNTELANRFDLEEERSKSMIQRVGALEVSLPNLLEALPDGAQVDRTNLTASVPPVEIFEAEGGSVAVRRQPLPSIESSSPAEQPLPDPVTTASTMPPAEGGTGVAIGPEVAPGTEDEAWRELSMKLGPLLFGLSPRIAEASQGGERRIVVGPFAQLAKATALCQQVESVSISCAPSPYQGTPLLP